MTAMSAMAVNVGTALYDIEDMTSKTWSREDVVLIRTRMLMDQLIPRKVVNGKSFIKYITIIVDTFQTIADERTKKNAMLSVADAIGGYIQGVMLPHLKDRYYKGLESYEVTNDVHGLARKIK